jgi:hypothetical protein
LSYYHSPGDTPANLDLRTLQHHGENLLAMARHLGRLDLVNVRRDDVVYCSILGRFVVIYPKSWVLPLIGCAALAYAGVVVLGVRWRRVRRMEVAAGIGIFLVALIAAAVAVGLLWFGLSDYLVRMGIVEFRSDLGGGTGGSPVSRFDVALLTGSAVVAVLIAGAIFAWASRRWSWEGLGLGVLAWWLAATVATSLALPGASYAFVWPLLAILAGQAVSFMVRRGGTIALIASGLAAIPLLLTQLMILPGIFDGLNLRMAAVLVVPVLYFAGALVPLAGQVLSPQPHEV